MARTCRFLGLDAHTFELTERYNVSGRAPAPLLNHARRLASSVQPIVKAALPPGVAGRIGRLRTAVDDRTLRPLPLEDHELRQRLCDWFRSDLEALAGLIGRDLSSWCAEADGVR